MVKLKTTQEAIANEENQNKQQKSKKNQSRRNNRSSRNSTTNNRPKSICKIFTCAELEGRFYRKMKSNASDLALKRADSSILYFHSSKKFLIKYKSSELRAIQDNKLSQAPPQCLYDPKIIKLNILKYNSPHTEQYEEECQNFREMLSNISLRSWDPKIVELLNKYNNSLLLYGQSSADNSPPQMSQDYQKRHVSWYDEKVESSGAPAYDKKLNFFDNITTTTYRSSRGRNNDYFSRFRPIRNAKGNSCSNERFGLHMSTDSGNSTDRSKTDDSLEKDGSDKKIPDDGKMNDFLSNSKNNDNDIEPEPEWFKLPVTRQDMIDLHGFEDDEEALRLATPVPETDGANLKERSPSARSTPTKKDNNCIENKSNTKASNEMNFKDFMNYHSVRNNETHNQIDNQRRMNDNSHNGRLSGRFRSHTMDDYNRNGYARSTSSLRSQNPSNNVSSRSDTTPFFDMWRRANANAENINFLNWASSNAINRSSGDNIQQNFMNQQHHHHQQQQQYQFQQQQQQNHAFRRSFPGVNMMWDRMIEPQQGLQQLFQQTQYNQVNLSMLHHQAPNHQRIGRNYQDLNYRNSIPTQEQLQQHTDEILKNALLRKQYLDDRKFKK